MRIKITVKISSYHDVGKWISPPEEKKGTRGKRKLSLLEKHKNNTSIKKLEVKWTFMKHLCTPFWIFPFLQSFFEYWWDRISWPGFACGKKNSPGYEYPIIFTIKEDVTRLIGEKRRRKKRGKEKKICEMKMEEKYSKVYAFLRRGK